MLLLLQRSPEREAALQQFLEDAHRPGSSGFHKWLKPAQFGELYGPTDAEIATVSGWLQEHGFSINRVSPAKSAIEFSGTVGQVRSAFHTEIHAYLVNGEEHYANNADPQIPAALAPVIAGITPINDFHPQSDLQILGKGLYDPRTHQVTPEWTLWGGAPPILALGPGDFAVQYDLNPLYSGNFNGAGITIGVIGASDIDPTAVANYHTMFGLPAPNFASVIDGQDTDPNHGNWAMFESYLDVEVSTSIAPGAMVNLYTAADTSVQSGLFLAAVRAVDDDQAAVLSTSYGECEADLGSAGNQFFASLWEQAAAQGQTSFVSAGDNGSAGCDQFGIGQPAQNGLAVSGFASTPWNISVGGTDFYYSSYAGSSSEQQTEIAKYWNLTATDQPAVSLAQPVPEQPWNQAFGLNLTDGGIYNPGANGVTIVAGSGGASIVYSKPAWQSGKGVPADKARDLPDLSLFASDGENDSFWLACAFDGCVQTGTGYEIFAVGGTSASTPAMAAIMAIIDQKYGAQGQAGFSLYPLAAQHASAFHDIAIGSNDVPCGGGPNCTQSTTNDNTNGFDTLGHYYATAGYDQATGLGSVDANLLFQNWNSLSFKSSITEVNVTPTNFTHGTPVTVSVSVTGTGGKPTGDVGLVTNASPASNTGIGEITLSGGAASTTLDDLPGGQYQLTAKYTGDTIFAPSTASVALNVRPESSTVSLTGNYWNNSTNKFAPIVSGASYPYGTYIVLDAQPRGVNVPAGQTDGLATGTLTFTDPVGSSSVNSGPVDINRLGIAEWQPATALPVGNNAVTASYLGDGSFQASSSNPALAFTITKAQTIADLFANPQAITVGSTTTLSLELLVPYSGPPCEDGACTFLFPFIPPPTGNATFSLANTQLGTAPVVPNTGASGYAWATLNVNSLPLGNDTVTASYAGDANYGPATTSFNVAVGEAPTLSAAASPSSINQAEYTAITTTVTGVSGMPTPTGTVSITAPANSNYIYFTDLDALKNGTAISQPLSGEPFLGNVAVDVSYSGDSVYGPADINVNFTVTQGTTLPFSLAGTKLSVTAGATTGNTSTVTVTPQGGFTGSVYLSCTLTSQPAGAIRLPTCSLPASVDITDANAQTATMTIASAAPTTIQTSFLPSKRPRLWTATAGLVLLGFCLLGTLSQRRNRGRITSFLLLMALFGIFAGCGGGSGNNGGGGKTQTIPGTTAGNYVFAVNGALAANGVAQVQTTVNVTVQ